MSYEKNPTMLTLAGWHVVLMDGPGIPPSEEARRIVRHGMKDILKWLGEEVGPGPEDQTVYFSESNRLMFATQPVLDKLNKYVEIGVKIKMPHKNDMWPSQNMYPDDGEGGIDVFSI